MGVWGAGGPLRLEGLECHSIYFIWTIQPFRQIIVRMPKRALPLP